MGIGEVEWVNVVLFVDFSLLLQQGPVRENRIYSNGISDIHHLFPCEHLVGHRLPCAHTYRLFIC